MITRLASEEVIKKYPIIKNKLLKDSRILNVSKATNPPEGNAASRNFYVENNEGVMGKLQPIDINFIEVFEEFDPERPFEYYFLDDRIEQLYRSEERLMKLTGIFSGICILISCLGLFGLAAFTTEQRTKEIGIRKVLGATTFQIIFMLSRSILLIVLAASVVASLIAYLAIDEWLTDFAYHAGINPLVFVLSAVLAMAVAFGTVALQSFKTAQANPVKALRYE